MSPGPREKNTNRKFSTDNVTRRGLLVALSTGAVATVAGCQGDGDRTQTDGSTLTETATVTEEVTRTTGTPTGTTTSEDGTATPEPETPTPDGEFEHVSAEDTREIVTAGEFERIYDPSVQGEEPLEQGPGGQWYFNDHTFVRDRDTGTWHLYGITHPEPASPLDEKNFGHATAESLTESPWEEQPFALTATGENTGPGEGGEHHLWAPHVIFHDGTYYMFYTGGVVDEPNPHERYKIQLATSRDLDDWERHPDNPLFEDGFDARDPHVIRYDDRWVLFYTATVPKSGGNHVVAYRTSDDLLDWGEKQVAFEHPATGTFGGPTESPCVVQHGGDWYLFVCCEPDYTSTQVYRSDDPLDFQYENRVGFLNDAGLIDAHGAQVLTDENGDWYVSHAGWGQGGVYLAPLRWDDEQAVSRQEVATPYYRATILTSPLSLVTSMGVDPAGERDYTRVLDTGYRGTGPYVAVGGWGPTDPPRAADTVTVSDDGREMTLGGIPLGETAVTVDWAFSFGEETFDISFEWHVDDPVSDVFEVAWTLDTSLPRIGDPGNLDRDRGNVSGFPDWAVGHGDSRTVAAAYESGSAWNEANHFFEPIADPEGASVVWQPFFAPGGKPLPAGDYDGGTWRLGASGSGTDTEFARQLYEDLNS